MRSSSCALPSPLLNRVVVPQVGVLFSVKCTATVRTLGYCDLLSLSKEALDDAMRDYPKQAQKISTLAQERMQQLGIAADVKRSADNERQPTEQ